MCVHARKLTPVSVHTEFSLTLEQGRKSGHKKINIAPSSRQQQRGGGGGGGGGVVMKCLKALQLHGREGPLTSRELVKLTIMFWYGKLPLTRRAEVTEENRWSSRGKIIASGACYPRWGPDVSPRSYLPPSPTPAPTPPSNFSLETFLYFGKGKGFIKNVFQPPFGLVFSLAFFAFHGFSLLVLLDFHF